MTASNSNKRGLWTGTSAERDALTAADGLLLGDEFWDTAGGKAWWDGAAWRGYTTNGAAHVLEQAAIPGSDATNDVQVTENRFDFIRTTANLLVKTGSGLVHTLTFACTDAAPTAGSITIYDNTSAAGDILHTEVIDSTTFFRSFTVTLDAEVTNGIYASFTTTADVAVGVSYR